MVKASRPLHLFLRQPCLTTEHIYSHRGSSFLHKSSVMEILSEAPQVLSFVPLIEHQSATPASFYSGPPVLHYHSQGCKVLVLESDVTKSAAIQRLVEGARDLNATNGNSSNNSNGPATEGGLTRRTIDNIDVWVSSESASPSQLKHDGLMTKSTENCSSIRLPQNSVFPYHTPPLHCTPSSHYQPLPMASNRASICSY